MVKKLSTLFDRAEPVLGKLHPLYCSARSPSGLWFGGGVAGNTTLLFSPDGHAFEAKRAPNGDNWSSLICVSDTHLVTGSRWGIEQTTDGCKTWKRTNESEIYKLSRAPDGTLWATANGAVLRSSNGAKWTAVHRREGTYFGAMHWQGDTMLLGGDGAIWRAGKKLETVLDTKGRYVQAIAERPDGLLLAVGGDGLLAVSKNGSTWKLVPGGGTDWFSATWSGDRFVLGGHETLATTTDGAKLARVALGKSLAAEAVLAHEDGVFICAGRASESGALLWWGGARSVSTGKRKTAKAQPTLAPIVRASVAPTRSAKPEPARWEDLRGRFSVRSRLAVAATKPPPTRTIAYRGNVSAKSLAWAAKPRERLAIVVDGDLWSDTILDLHATQDEDAALLVYVTGNVSVRDVAVRDDAALVVAGSLEAERLVMCGGGNLGTIVVNEELRAGLVLEWTDGAIEARKGAVPVWASERENVTVRGARWITEPAAVLDAGVLDAEGLPEQDLLYPAARKGKIVFRSRTRA